VEAPVEMDQAELRRQLRTQLEDVQREFDQAVAEHKRLQHEWAEDEIRLKAKVWNGACGRWLARRRAGDRTRPRRVAAPQISTNDTPIRTATLWNRTVRSGSPSRPSTGNAASHPIGWEAACVHSPGMALQPGEGRASAGEGDAGAAAGERAKAGTIRQTGMVVLSPSAPLLVEVGRRACPTPAPWARLPAQ
jgi:hypothetical protein